MPALLFVLLLYVGVGSGLAIFMLGLTGFRQLVDRIALRLNMSTSYARLVWLAGTILAWPVGLVVLVTGRLVLVNDDIAAAAMPSGTPPTPHAELPSQPDRRYCPPADASPISSRNWSIDRW